MTLPDLYGDVVAVWRGWAMRVDAPKGVGGRGADVSA
jgi:hypothetical protein